VLLAWYVVRLVAAKKCNVSSSAQTKHSSSKKNIILPDRQLLLAAIRVH